MSHVCELRVRRILLTQWAYEPTESFHHASRWPINAVWVWKGAASGMMAHEGYGQGWKDDGIMWRGSSMEGKQRAVTR